MATHRSTNMANASPSARDVKVTADTLDLKRRAEEAVPVDEEVRRADHASTTTLLPVVEHRLRTVEGTAELQPVGDAGQLVRLAMSRPCSNMASRSIRLARSPRVESCR